MPAAYDLHPESPFALLPPEQVAAWYAYMKVHLRIRYEMNRQLRADSGISLSDYDVLVALTSEPERRMSVSDLAIRIGWERSRLSHHLRRMNEAELVKTATSLTDRRVTEVELTTKGQQTLRDASPAHVEFVKAAFFSGLGPADVEALTTGLEKVYDSLIENGTLPRPADHP
jgi:DNA-binding MarR family transcriptional regulator